MTSHQLIGSELTIFIEQLKPGQFIANLIHNPPGVYTAWVIDKNQQPELCLNESNSEPSSVNSKNPSPSLTSLKLQLQHREMNPVWVRNAGAHACKTAVKARDLKRIKPGLYQNP